MALSTNVNDPDSTIFAFTDQHIGLDRDATAHRRIDLEVPPVELNDMIVPDDASRLETENVCIGSMPAIAW